MQALEIGDLILMQEQFSFIIIRKRGKLQAHPLI
jgi:hypothetical protein